MGRMALSMLCKTQCSLQEVQNHETENTRKEGSYTLVAISREGSLLGSMILQTSLVILEASMVLSMFFFS